MPRSEFSSKNDFDLLLNWLDTDTNSAIRKYESIRERLTSIFFAKGCYFAEELVDETIERVTKKAPKVSETFEGDPAIYFYAVGKNVFHEWSRKPQTEELPTFVSADDKNINVAELRDECLTKCMGQIDSRQSDFIISYYKYDKKQKIEFRKELATELGITTDTLRVRIFRIRKILQKCVLKCVEK